MWIQPCWIPCLIQSTNFAFLCLHNLFCLSQSHMMPFLSNVCDLFRYFTAGTFALSHGHHLFVHTVLSTARCHQRLCQWVLDNPEKDGSFLLHGSIFSRYSNYLATCHTYVHFLYLVDHFPPKTMGGKKKRERETENPFLWYFLTAILKAHFLTWKRSCTLSLLSAVKA